MIDYLDTGLYRIAAELLPRLLGALYVIVFFPFLFQIKGLLGSGGILPVTHFLEAIHGYYGKKRFYAVPTLLWINSSDGALLTLVSAGVVAGLLLALGVWPPLMLILLFIFHLSLISAGQDFLGFGWESLLLEMTLNSFFLSLTSPTNPIVWLSVNFLLFRFIFQAGASKLMSGDTSWRDLTAVSYHYISQPIPNLWAWFADKLPMWMHKGGTLGMFVMELVIPFGIFANEQIRWITFLCLALLQVVIWFTGNFSYLNYQTLIFSVILISDHYFESVFGMVPPSVEASSLWLEGIAYVGGAVLLFLQVVSFYHYFYPNEFFQKILRAVSPFHVGNRYGLFAVMTKRRLEVVIEGSDDGVNWKEYGFKHKPSEVERRPRRVSPYQPRLDWQIWFIPLGSRYDTGWFNSFLTRLLQGSSDVVRLLRVNPFKEKPPRYIRALLYDYRFSDWTTLRTKRVWWERKFVGPFTGVLTLKR